MKKIFFATALASLVIAGHSCKSKKTEPAPDTTVTTPATTTQPPPAPVTISPDDALKQGVTDATKDIKGLTARVDSGIIHLSGTITKADQMRIMPTLSSLHPKKIDSKNLTVK